MFFSTQNFPLLQQQAQNEYDKVGADKINNLLRGKKISGEEKLEPQKFYNEDAVKELQDYCQRMNIMGINFGNRDPREILRMLKGRLEPHKQINENKKQILQG